MAFRINDAPFIGEHRDEFTRRMEYICNFLRDPPSVFAPAAVIVIAAADPVHIAGIEDVAPLIEQSPVVPTIHRDLAMPMELATRYAEVSVGPTSVATDRLDGRGVNTVRCMSFWHGVAT